MSIQSSDGTAVIDFRNVLYGAINEGSIRDKEMGREFAKPLMSKKYLMTKSKTYTESRAFSFNFLDVTIDNTLGHYSGIA